MVEKERITVEVCEIEGESDLCGLLTIGTTEYQLSQPEIYQLIQGLRSVEFAIIWHRATWKYTRFSHVEHLARKDSDRVLCGTKPRYPNEWEFSPYFDAYLLSHPCKRCVAIYEKQKEAQSQ